MATSNLIRPWGLLPWVLSKLPEQKWSLIGCIGTEDRCLASWSHFREKNLLCTEKMVKIDDWKSGNYDNHSAAQVKSKRQNDVIFDQYVSSGGQTHSVRDAYLLTQVSEIIEIVDTFIQDSNANLVVDITSLPKRFFFPFLKRILRKSECQNLVVTYSIPQHYSKVPLADNAQDPTTIPLFGNVNPDVPAEQFIIGAGFETLGLHSLMDQKIRSEIRLLLPFPPGPPASHRSWNFIRSLNEKTTRITNPVRVDARDASHAFNLICAFTDQGGIVSEFAPYGPKSHSLAICLYASLTNSTVWYTQPTSYNPHYSSGIAEIDGERAIYAYPIRIKGRDLYWV